MTALQNFTSHSFANYAAKNIRVSQDRNGLFCQVPDKSGKWYTVRCMESKKSVHASHCNCSTFATHQHCEHIDLVQTYWNKLYKVETPQVEAPVPPVVEVVKKARKPRNGLVRKVRNGGLVKVAKVPAAPIVECNDVKVSVPVINKITDVSKLGNLNVSQGFSILR